ncbi:ABC transporter ATP-binding protein [Bordetella genomosp. 1]|uniref:Cell division ATP-binding protein FtsE n=1 Tax=Bordetella genomosp. 1 TaxID=1395607 RepID=A0A261SD72_9BORD|nr:methionine ABC transporter ATP-binding protein [Bordetella genomosp. 1]MDQ8035223.1 methionine ABC transporter ATP-binding protein [Bordetella sp.]OZI35358.1 ABC transporter ATP-binding protein [Bordetella genomosp. 1]OZI63903.1 ABC transporter ATP-binding protein [Bordetella genomosp. 1]
MTHDSPSSTVSTVPTPVIRLDHVSKSFRIKGTAFDAVRDVSLSIRAGDIFGLIGKSGAGKSTLLRLINLLERPDSGSVQVDGAELTRLSKRDLRAARQRIGMIFQQFNLLQNETVFENVAFPLRVHGGRGRDALRERVRTCLDIVGLADKAASYPAQLSGGQKQRVAIARALASEPAVLLCDEPTSALDTETTRSLLAVLRDINQRLGVTIVIVTHELAVVRALCRHVAVLEDGRVIEQAEIAGRNVQLHSSLGRELVREADNPYEAVA